MEKNNSSNGISFFGLLGIVFIVLKLTGFINWPWIWVLGPLWCGFALAVVIFGVFFLAKVLIYISEKKK